MYNIRKFVNIEVHYVKKRIHVRIFSYIMEQLRFILRFYLENETK